MIIATWQVQMNLTRATFGKFVARNQVRIVSQV